ncbi:YadA C-terminal domain-containing protein [Vibrio comitans]|uniref:Trimeric autotransporter adhesin YadA-like C-terminal membrane anchor domain-containing protein n=1 Tax=Vibrio comitans NBRC 102076 TaxID=1219078 RepID=A0A4Y3IL44_9VIBR|nr:YadA C-terminal domain-containing protein [Vibrio comitans]GEA59722.1 hypothetical protein VCO01S_09150 [Vibrio comitans NBRC 102076]
MKKAILATVITSMFASSAMADVLSQVDSNKAAFNAPGVHNVVQGVNKNYNTTLDNRTAISNVGTTAIKNKDAITLNTLAIESHRERLAALEVHTTENSNSVKSVKDELANTQAAVGHNTAELFEANERISQISSSTSSLKPQVEMNTHDIGALADIVGVGTGSSGVLDSIKKTQRTAEDAQYSANQNTTDIADNSNRIGTNHGLIADNAKEIKANMDYTSSVELNTMTNAQDIQATTDYVAHVEENTVVNAHDIQANTDYVASVEANTITNAQDIQATTDYVAHVEENTVVNAHDIQANTDYVSSVEANTVTNAQDIQANTDYVAHVEENTVVNAHDIQANKVNTTTNSKRIDTQNSAIDANYGRTRANQAHIADNSNRIAQNESDIAQNKTDIQDLRSAFEEQAKVMDGAMAQGIATSSLVMPYNVGKISTTVALGHSGEANAIAGGVGVRFTENFTARSNIAYDTGSENVSIGAGVGYEW